MNKIKLDLLGKKIWVSIDPNDRYFDDRFVANVVVGILEVDHPGTQYLVHSEQLLEKTNYSTISKLFDKCIQNIGVEHNNVLLFISDTAPYMVKLLFESIIFKNDTYNMHGSWSS